MKIIGFILFFTVFIGVYTAGNYYIFNRAWQAVSHTGWNKALIISVFVFLWLSFIVGRFTGHTHCHVLHHIFAWVGSFWIAAALYFFLAVVLVDLVRLTNFIAPFLPDAGSAAYLKLKTTSLFAIIAIVTLLIVYGYINASHPRVNRLEITTNKKIEGYNELKIGLASDIHLGTIIGPKKLNKLAALFDKEKPDIIFLAGDLLDEAQDPIIFEDIGAPLRKLSAPLGVYAVPGNHEYIGGAHKALAYIQSLNLILLRDSVAHPVKGLSLIGRDDYQMGRFTGLRRKSLDSLMLKTDPANFLIVIDHQPATLHEAAKNEIDLQVSGHTHDGQFWPISFITRSIYEISKGYGRIGNTHVFVSTGFGTWGPPVRIGNRPEIVIITVKSN